MFSNIKSRRNFLKNTILFGTSTTGFLNINSNNVIHFESKSKESNLNFLFQGDSITDGNRGRSQDPNHILGHGYAFSISSRIGASFPEKENQFYNRGISGNKITDLAARWQVDTLDLKPDVLSILIGVNDTDAALRNQSSTTMKGFDEMFRSLLDQTRKQIPECLIVLCEPFILPVGRVKENWKAWNEDMQKRQIAIHNISKDYHTIFVPLQKIFTNAAHRYNNEYWMWDGIHPTYSGHELITREWLKQVRKQLHFLRQIHF